MIYVIILINVISDKQYKIVSLLAHKLLLIVGAFTILGSKR